MGRKCRRSWELNVRKSRGRGEKEEVVEEEEAGEEVGEVKVTEKGVV